MKEKWKNISGYEGFYQVSDLGNVRSVGGVTNNPSGKVQTVKERVLKNRIESGTGYPRVSLWRDGKSTKVYTHALVARAFVPNPQEKPQVNHLDSDRTNNAASNLEWVTGAENLSHARDKGRMFPPPHAIGTAHHNAKLTPDAIRDIRIRASDGSPYTKVAALHGVSPSTIRMIVIGRIWNHVE